MNKTYSTEKHNQLRLQCCVLSEDRIKFLCENNRVIMNNSMEMGITSPKMEK